MGTIYDIHVHLAGTGAGGSDCWMHPRKRNGLVFSLIRYWHGISREDLETRLEERVLELLTGWIEECPDLYAVLLPLDWVRDDAGEPDRDLTDLYIPNDFVLRAAARHARFLAGASIHPFRPDAIEELHRVTEAGAVLVKWLPVSQGFSPDDERCLPFYDALTNLNMPLLTHTGSEGATRILRKGANNPESLRPALDAGVTVIAAHAGMASLPIDRDYSDVWREMLESYPNLYGDTASWFGFRAWRGIRAARDAEACKRLLHGSDWPVPCSPWWFLGAIPLKRIRKLARIRNPLLRDIQTKRTLGLPEDVFSRAGELLALRGNSGIRKF